MSNKKYVDSECVHKLKNMASFCELITNNYEKEGHYLLLDGIHTRSSSALISRSIATKEQIHVAEIDYETYKTIEKTNICDVYHGDIEEYITKNEHRETIEKIYAAYFDFMGSVEGSIVDDRFPLEAITNFLAITKHKKLIIAFTFALRDKHKKFNDEECMQDQIESFLKNCFSENQFRIVERKSPIVYKKTKNSEDYPKRGQTMAFFLYVLQKDNTIDPYTIEHFYENGRFCGYRWTVNEKLIKKSKNKNRRKRTNSKYTQIFNDFDNEVKFIKKIKRSELQD